MADNKHITADQRSLIQQGLDLSQSFKEIAQSIGKDPSTISKEIRSHLLYVNTGGYGRPFNPCRRRFSCDAVLLCDACVHPDKKNRCRFCAECYKHCGLFEKETCSRLAKPPYVCNGCKDRTRCTLEKKLYNAVSADREYRAVLSESRSGVNLTEAEQNYLDSVVSPLIRQGQSLHHICATNQDSVTVSQSTLYRYVDARVISASNLDLPRKVRFKPRKITNHVKVDKSCRIGRSYQDFNIFLQENPDVTIVQMDSVEGKKGESVLLTLHFMNAGMMLAYKRPHNTSGSVIEIFDRICSAIGMDEFYRIAMVCLTDNGTEFSNPLRLEFQDNKRRTHVFYCDPSAPYQKGACERNHEFIRCFLPKGKSFEPYSQEQISLMMDHINSYARERLGGKCPYEMFEYLYGKKLLELLGCHRIPPQEVTLNSSIFSQEGNHA